jgi:P4 family phage/plasmid primase-like protien
VGHTKCRGRPASENLSATVDANHFAAAFIATNSGGGSAQAYFMNIDSTRAAVGATGAPTSQTGENSWLPAAITTPTLAQLRTIAQALTKSSDAESVRGVLRLVPAIAADELDRAELLGLIAARTIFSGRTLRRSLNELVEEAAAGAPDSAALLADAVLAEEFSGLLKFAPDGHFWRFDRTHWTRLPAVVVRRVIMDNFRRTPNKFDGDKTNVIVRAAYTILSDRCGEHNDPMAVTLTPKPVVNLQNGELWLDGPHPSRRPHDPQSGLTQVLPIDYDPSAVCPRFSGALGEVFASSAAPDSMVRHMMELIGYAIQPIRDHPKIVVFHGAGANGKTSLLRVMMALVGPDQVYAGPVSSLSRDRFSTSQLSGRLLFVDDDLRQGVTLDDGQLKTIAEAKVLTTRRPYGHEAFNFKAVALPVLATNNVPRINDPSHGFARRLMVIPFNQRFDGSDRKLDLFDDIIRDELSGILNAALAGLQRLRKRGAFDEPEDCVAAKASFLAQATPLRAFVSECLTPLSGGKITMKAVYEALGAWSRQNQSPQPIARNALKSRLEAMGLTVSKGHPGDMFLRDFEFARTNSA